MIKLVIYDCDGVLVDSTESILTYYSWMADKCGIGPIDWTENDIRSIALSYADKDILEVLAKGNQELYAKMLHISKTDAPANDFTKMTMFDDLVEGLEIVKQCGMYTAICTNRGRSLPTLLDHFNIAKYFDMCVTSNDVTLPKPSPEGVFKICDNFGVSPQEVLFVGDSPTDYHAAKTAGAKFLSYRKELYGSDIIKNHKDIMVYL